MTLAAVPLNAVLNYVLGTADVAAHAVAIRAAGIAYALPIGLLQAAVVRTSRAEALADAAARRETLATGLATGLALGTAVGAVLFLLIAGAAFLPHHLSAAAGDGAAKTAAALLLLVALIQIYDAPGAVAAGILRGRLDTRAPMIITLVGYWAVSAPLGIWLAIARDMGAVGIWIGLATGTAVSSALLLACLRS